MTQTLLQDSFNRESLTVEKLPPRFSTVENAGNTRPSNTSNCDVVNEKPLQKRSGPLVTTRIGFLFAFASIAALGCALAANLLSTSQSFAAIMWVSTIAICSMVGLISMRSVKTLRTIEGELIRSANQPERWHNARPIVGEDDVTAGWNQLLAEIESIKSENAQRAPAALDQQAITMARAMRGLGEGSVFTLRLPIGGQSRSGV